jgi:flagellar motor switch protein FliG
MGNDRITGPQKAAIFLFSLGEDVASEIVKRLDEEDIKKLGNSMAKISSISPSTIESIFAEFQQMASSDRPIHLGSTGKNQFLKNVFSKAMEEEKAQSLMETIQGGEKGNLFQKIRKLDSKTLANFLQNEHPQTIALILAHLEPGRTAAILEGFPPPLQTEIIFRISQLENVPEGILEEIDQTIQKEMSVFESVDGRKVGGVGSVANILNQMDSTTENTILQSLEEQKEGLADEIRKLMFMFEDLLNVDDRSILTILKDISSDTLKIALKTASDELKEKVFRNMSERAAALLKEDMEVMGPVRLKDVEAAQQSIIQSAKKLETEGKIVLVGKGKEDVFV